MPDTPTLIDIIPVDENTVIATLTKDEKRLIAAEIEAGKRPRHWNDPAHKDYMIWGMMIAACKDAGVTKRI